MSILGVFLVWLLFQSRAKRQHFETRILTTDINEVNKTTKIGIEPTFRNSEGEDAH